jgi:uncharacterized protein YeaO (DUF488 family)
VDRLWPRGVRKSTPNVEIWMADIAPTDELRKWYQHDPKKWVRFKQRYIKELQKNGLVEELVNLVVNTSVTTFVYAASDTAHNNAAVLKEFVERAIKKVK